MHSLPLEHILLLSAETSSLIFFTFPACLFPPATLLLLSHSLLSLLFAFQITLKSFSKKRRSSCSLFFSSYSYHNHLVNPYKKYTYILSRTSAFFASQHSLEIFRIVISAQIIVSSKFLQIIHQLVSFQNVFRTFFKVFLTFLCKFCLFALIGDYLEFVHLRQTVTYHY